MRGFANLGNTCYFNVILQCLVHTPPLAAMYSKRLRNSPFGRVVVEYVEGEARDKMIAPEELLAALRRRAPSLEPGKPHDAHEAFMYLLDVIHGDTNDGTFPVPESPYHRAAHPKAAIDAWPKRGDDYSFATDVFMGQIKSNDNYEPFVCIELSPTRTTTVDALIFDYFQPEEVGDVTIRRKLHYAPICLCVSFKQFTGGHRVVLKETTNLDWFVDREYEPAFVPEYELYGVVLHSGGHYTCAIKYDGEWYMCDDGVVRRIRFDNICDSMAYIAFYKAILDR